MSSLLLGAALRRAVGAILTGFGLRGGNAPGSGQSAVERRYVRVAFHLCGFEVQVQFVPKSVCP